MNKVLSGIKKYTPYVMLLLGIWIIVTFFIAGGIKTNPKAINPNTGEVYYFTVFQVMFGKGFKVGNATLTYFKMNLFGFMGLIFGPIMVSITLLLIQIYNDEFSDHEDPELVLPEKEKEIEQKIDLTI